MSKPSIDRDQAIARLREEVARFGWAVTEDEKEDLVAVAITHDLSTRRTLLIRDADARPPGVTVGNFLEYDEIRTVAGAPGDMPHRALVGEIRSSAFGGQWPAGVLVSVARLLRAHGILTEAESMWIEEAGVPWSSKRRG